MQLTGNIKLVGDIQEISPTFKKRELVITTDEQYPQTISIEFVQDKCSLLDGLNVDQKVKVSINLRGKTSIADYMVIASGTSSRHIQSLSEILLKELQNNGINKCKIEGRASSDWKLIDAIDIIIHIFHPDKRKFYDLEKMWSEPIAKDRLSV